MTLLLAITLAGCGTGREIAASALNTSSSTAGVGSAAGGPSTSGAPLPITSQPGSTPRLPDELMTSLWPLNQPATDLPAETRSLLSSWTDGQYTPKPIAATFTSVFGPNHVGFDTTMPWTVVDTRETPEVLTGVTINHPEWGSDDGTTCAPMVAGATLSTGWPARAGAIEGASDPAADHHLLVMDTATNRLYELFGVTTDAAAGSKATYRADAARCWDVTRPEHGTPGQNSADAAGLPILPLLLRYDEASRGSILHALRFTVSLTRADANGGAFSLPASHAAGNNYSSVAYGGMRLRLRADFDSTPFSPINRAIIQALKTYGIVVADNGRSGLITADMDSRWNNDDLAVLRGSMTLADFVVLNSGSIIDSTGNSVQ